MPVETVAKACGECMAAGTIEFAFSDGTVREQECPVCGGAGWLEVAAVARRYPFACCDHCGCKQDVASDWGEGHDDTCAHGCNDTDLGSTDA